MDAVDLALQADKQSAAITIPDKAAGMLEGGRNKEEDSECTCVVHCAMTQHYPNDIRNYIHYQETTSDIYQTCCHTQCAAVVT